MKHILLIISLFIANMIIAQHSPINASSHETYYNNSISPVLNSWNHAVISNGDVVSPGMVFINNIGLPDTLNYSNQNRREYPICSDLYSLEMVDKSWYFIEHECFNKVSKWDIYLVEKDIFFQLVSTMRQATPYKAQGVELPVNVKRDDYYTDRYQIADHEYHKILDAAISLPIRERMAGLVQFKYNSNESYYLTGKCEIIADPGCGKVKYYKYKGVVYPVKEINNYDYGKIFATSRYGTFKNTRGTIVGLVAISDNYYSRLP